jgi:hypothetical protein
MPTIVAVWPDDSFSVVKMPRGYSLLDLFWKLDEEADPGAAYCYEVNGGRYGMHIAFNKRDNEARPLPGALQGGVTYIPWPKDIHEQLHAALRRNAEERGVTVTESSMSLVNHVMRWDPPIATAD